ncbi:MAG TPA: NADH-quinone oxidoreductase subunit J [Burkholderiales bacterium]|nr:NADH-quinone oxidoreductase subunit J [Burkholderiales bacterium]
MEFKQFVFYAFAAIMLFAATLVITVRNPVKAVLSLVLTFVSAAGLWFLLQAEFLAIALVLVYVGAVMVLFLFVVMMLDINIARIREGFAEYLPYGGFIAVLLVIEMALILSAGHFSTERLPEPAGVAADHSNTRALGRLIYTHYAYPFEIAALLLLVAIVAAIVLTLRKRKNTKYIDPAAQINVRREDRVRIVKMPSEKKG